MFPWTGPSIKDAQDRSLYRAYQVNPAGLVPWVDFVPVEEVGSPNRVDSYDNEGAIRVSEVVSTAGLVQWVDYIPVAILARPLSGRWRFDSTGYIPVFGLGGAPSYTPSLNFSDNRNSQYLTLVSVGGL